ncbi:MAG: disulfide bond formation protein B [Chromatiaceae bacterium]|nr:disulfide bond formation protein B [Chromatiaceae bacterium]
MFSISTRALWLTLALGGCGVAFFSILLTTWLRLDPCHLCIAQRLFYLLLGLTAGIAALGAKRLWGWISGVLVLIIALAGAAMAAYQSWLQLQPPGSISCLASRPGLIEQGIEWLGERWPALFLATGFCEDPGMRLLGLTLANWALAGFMLCAALALLALWRDAPRTSRTTVL